MKGVIIKGSHDTYGGRKIGEERTMSDKELLLAMSELIDAKLKPMTKKLDDMDIRIAEMQVQIDTLRLDIKTSERAIKRDIHQLQDGMDTLVEVLEQKGILPKVE